VSARHVDILALFPSFDSALFGGVQASGREAWASINNRQAVSAEAFYYEAGASRLATLLRATARRVAADTVLVWHSGLLKLAPFINASNRSASKRRLILFLHGIEAWRDQDPFTRALMRRTDLFLSNSEHTWKRFTSLHPFCAGKPHQTVYLGLGAPLPCPPAPPEGPPSALMIGRMQKDENYKGHREMIEVWPRVLTSMPAAELRIAGDGDLRPELERLAQKLGLADRVRFYGAIPDSRKQDLLRQCRSLVLPSAGEGFGLVYLEAMRMGRPCIVSNLDAGSEVVNPPEAGLAVDLNNSPHVASTILRLLTAGPEWEQMSARAQHRYESNFTARHFAQRLEDALFKD
jgi:phosphatidyl-myo-inositol dimannoside synthase